MTNYLPIYILISLIPLVFLAIACCSTNATVQTLNDLEMQCIRVHGPYPPSNRDLHRTVSLMKARSGSPFSQTSLDQLPPPPPPRQSRTPGPISTSQHHRAAALASLERPRSSSSSSTFNDTPDHLPPRPSAPSPPSSTASAGWLYSYRSRQWWEEDEDEVDNVAVGSPSGGRDVAMPAFRSESVLPGRKSALRLESQGGGWTDVSLR